MKAAGQGGRLLVGYQQAAAIVGWSMESTATLPPQTTINALLRRIDTFWITQQPVTLELPVGRTTWRWDRVSLALDGPKATMLVTGRPLVIKE